MTSEVKDSFTLKDLILNELKTKFGESSRWKDIEAEIALRIIEIPDVVTEKNKSYIIKNIKDLKEFLLSKEFENGWLEFLDLEIERLEQVKQISLYQEQEDKVPKEIVERYARISFNTEGMVGIHLPYNFKQLSTLTNEVFKKTGLIKFYVSREKTIYGKIVAEIYEYAQKIVVARLIESKKLDSDTQLPSYKKCILFGEKFNPNSVNVIKEIEHSFHVYRFISEHGEDFILFSIDPIEIGDYIITGMATQCDDYKQLTESSKLPTKLPYFFIQEHKNRIIKFKNNTEFNEKLMELQANKNTLFQFPFTVKSKDKLYLLNVFEWYKWFVWAWLVHKPVGMFNEYPLHIMVSGPKGSGKSMLLNCLHAKTKESKDVFSGSSSTLKNLIPSFKYSIARLGYLAESNRFSFCDEFLRCITRSNSNGNSFKEESVAMMNDLLEHQKREAGSGVSRVNINMTSRIYATTNPVRDIHSMEDLLGYLDESFLSRWLIYFQTPEDVQLVRRSNDRDLKLFDYNVSDNDFIAIIDYLQTFESSYNFDRVAEIFEKPKIILSEILLDHYDARHKHHIECLMDGIVKTRCLISQDKSFKANEEDYKMLENIWYKIISSWVKFSEIKKFPLKERIRYLPETCQYVYNKILEKGDITSKEELSKLSEKELTGREITDSLIILIDNEIVFEVTGGFKLYFMGPNWKPNNEVENDKEEFRL